MSVSSEPRNVLAQNPAVLSTEVGEELALMSVAHGRYYSLNPVASNIWRRLAQPTAVDDLVSVMRQEYAGDPDRIDADVRALMRQLATEGLVEINLLGHA